MATLLNNGANPNLQEKVWCCCLKASFVDHVVSTVYLHTQTSEWTPLHFAAKEGFADIAGLLLEFGAKMMVQDKVWCL